MMLLSTCSVSVQARVFELWRGGTSWPLTGHSEAILELCMVFHRILLA